MIKTLNLLAISDIHLGHSKTKTQFIVDNLNKCFCNEKVLSQVDLVVFVGDVFDKLLALNSDDAPIIDLFLAKFLRICRKFSIVVRVLEGTPSHDRQQSDRFTIINEIHEKNSSTHIDLKHVKTLSVEYIEKFDINVLYVPDEWKPTAEETLAEVKSLLIEKQLDKVDFAFMHGQFGYQLPAHIPNMPRHCEAEYLKLVRYLIFVGHIHFHSVYERIIAQGSFDRLAQGEENAKGYVKAIVRDTGDYELFFIENKNAKKYVTVNCHHEDLEENIKKIDREVEKLPAESYIRVRADKSNPILSNLNVLKARWPLLIWSTLADAEEHEDNYALINSDVIYTPINIDKDNIVDLVFSRLIKLNLKKPILDMCLSKLKEMETI